MSRRVEIDIESDADTGGFLATAAAADRAARRVDELGDEMRGTARDAAELDVALVKTKAKIHELGQEYVKTGDKDAFKNLRDNRGILAGLQQIAQESDKIALGSLFHGASVDADLLKRRINETRIAVNELGAAYVKSGDKDVLKSLREQRGTLQVLEQIAKGLGDAGKGARELGDAADGTAVKAQRLGDNLRSSGEGARSLEERIKASKAAIVALGEAFAKTGDKDVFKNLSEERGTLRNLEQIGREIEKFGHGNRKVDFGDFGNISGVFSAGFKALPTEIKVALVAGAAAAAPAIVATVSGALLVGLSGATIAGGILVAVRSPEVKAAWKEFGHGAFLDLAESASVLEGPLINAAAVFKRGVSDIGPSLRADFEAVAPAIGQLANGVVGLFDKFQPGFLEGLKGAEPVMRQFAEVLPALGEDLGTFFATLGSQGPGAADALELSIRLLGETLVALGNLMATASAAFELFGGTLLLAADRAGVLDTAIQLLTGAPGLTMLAAKLHEARGSADGVTSSFQLLNAKAAEAPEVLAAYTQGLTTAKQIMQEGRQAADDMEMALSNLARTMLNNVDADLAFKQGHLNLLDALKASKGSLDETTSAGLNAERAILSQAQAAVRLRDATFEKAKAQMNDVDAMKFADAVFDAHIQQIYDDAAAYGVSSEAVDRLTGNIRGLPKSNPIDIILKRLGLSDGEISRVKSSLESTAGTYTSTLNVVTNYISRRIDQGNLLPGGVRAQAKGGIVAAARGLITSSPTILFGERETGQEAFIPKRGISRGRAAGLLGTAADWYGYGLADRRRSGYDMPVMANGGASSGVVVNVYAGLGTDGYEVGQQILDVLRPVMSRYGGDVQLAFTGRSVA